MISSAFDLFVDELDLPDLGFVRTSSAYDPWLDGLEGRCCKSQRVGEPPPLSPAVSRHAFDLGSAEGVEAVHESDTDVDFGCLAVRIS